MGLRREGTCEDVPWQLESVVERALDKDATQHDGRDRFPRVAAVASLVALAASASLVTPFANVTLGQTIYKAYGIIARRARTLFRCHD